jgi:hypothetical protein
MQVKAQQTEVGKKVKKRWYKNKLQKNKETIKIKLD